MAKPQGAVVTAQYQRRGVAELAADGRSLTVQGRHARLRIELATRAGVRLEAHAERSLHDTHWGCHFADCRWFPATAAYAADGDEPLVTVFRDVTDGAAGPPRVAREDGELRLALPSGGAVRFVRLADGWRPDYSNVR